jgi:3' terminal RNA ribose 2'-O-methyltransferase Hen1
VLLTLTYTGPGASDLGFLLHKHPGRAQAFGLSHGRGLVFYPEVSEQRTTAALLLDINPVDLVRGTTAGLFDYVSDRPYVSSSLMSTAIARVFGTALSGRADSHQELADSALDLSATVAVLPCAGQQDRLRPVFEPLGYQVDIEPVSAAYVHLSLRGTVRLRDLLNHLYVLLPVFDRRQHYWVAAAEVDKLLSHGGVWLANHPEQGYITSRYLKRQPRLVAQAVERLAQANLVDGEELDLEDDDRPRIESGVTSGDATRVEPAGTGGDQTMAAQRLAAVLQVLRRTGASSVVDLGCGEGRLLEALARDAQFRRITGMDVSASALARAARRLHLDQASDHKAERIQLLHGSLTYRDARLAGYDAACLVEVIEHLDQDRLPTVERVVFEVAHPGTVIVTTPNQEYNAQFEHLAPGHHRHADHRFEWTRRQFQDWATAVGAAWGYTVQVHPIGTEDPTHGAPTQMAVFSR